MIPLVIQYGTQSGMAAWYTTSQDGKWSLAAKQKARAASSDASHASSSSRTLRAWQDEPFRSSVIPARYLHADLCPRQAQSLVQMLPLHMAVGPNAHFRAACSFCRTDLIASIVDAVVRPAATLIASIANAMLMPAQGFAGASGQQSTGSSWPWRQD